jgi:hypothetical protein
LQLVSDDAEVQVGAEFEPLCRRLVELADGELSAVDFLDLGEDPTVVATILRALEEQGILKRV